MPSENGLKDKVNSNNIYREGRNPIENWLYTGAPGQVGPRKLLNQRLSFVVQIVL